MMTRFAPPLQRPLRAHRASLVLACVCGLFVLPVSVHGDDGAADSWTVDHRYQPPWWQTSVCLPDDELKTMVRKDGALLYDYLNVTSERDFNYGLRVRAGVNGPVKWTGQEMVSPKVPVVVTHKQSGALLITEETFTVAPPLEDPSGVHNDDSLGPDKNGKPIVGPPRNVVVIMRIRNGGTTEAAVVPTLTIETQSGSAMDGYVVADESKTKIECGDVTTIVWTTPYDFMSRLAGRTDFFFPKVKLAAGEEYVLAFGVGRGPHALQVPSGTDEAEHLLQQTKRYWEKLDLPWGHIEVPDPGIQSLVDSSIRNIYQARVITNGLPAFQVGPGRYRGFWAIDGSFMIEAVTLLGRVEEARRGLDYLFSFQDKDGIVKVNPVHWKETGIALYAVTHHARLTNDKEWLSQMWPKVEAAVGGIQKIRRLASEDPNALNYGLVPPGYSDGGLRGLFPEYTNVYWSMAGVKAACEAAEWMGKTGEAADWRKEYADFHAAFERAAVRDMRIDDHGNRYLPIRMGDEANINIRPQRAQYSFFHAVYPGRVLDPHDPIVTGNMAMLRATEREGLVYGSGWAAQGVWNYCGSFYAHAWLWLGQGQKAAQTLYAFANHASPLGAWVEEQSLQGCDPVFIGDMPHNWASAEFIRLVRNLLVLERGDELHLFEGLPPTWVARGKVTRLDHVLTQFGEISLELRAAGDGSSVHLHIDQLMRNPPAKILLHLDGWSGRSGVIELPTDRVVDQDIELSR